MRRALGRTSRRGATTVEMTLVGIPLIFMLISIFEISRGMWIYHTLSYAVKEGVRYASVHGQNCVYNSPSVTNNCQVTIGDQTPSCTAANPAIATVIRCAGVGLDPSTTQLTFCTPSCNSGSAPTCYLNDCSTSTYWPPSGSNQVGQTIEIDILVPFRSALALFWPGTKSVKFGVVNFGAASRDTIKF